jgi:hypothetical protein
MLVITNMSSVIMNLRDFLVQWLLELVLDSLL